MFMIYLTCIIEYIKVTITGPQLKGPMLASWIYMKKPTSDSCTYSRPANILQLLFLVILGRFPYNCSLVRNCFQWMFSAVRTIHVQEPCVCLLSFSVRVQVSLPQSSTDSTARGADLNISGQVGFPDLLQLVQCLSCSAFTDLDVILRTVNT